MSDHPNVHHHYLPQHSHEQWHEYRPPMDPRTKTVLRAVVLGVGALLVAGVTFFGVAAYELATSQPAKQFARAARDTATASAVEMSAKAECQRLVAEARASGNYTPPCAKRLGLDQAPKPGSSDTLKMLETVAVQAID